MLTTPAQLPVLLLDFDGTVCLGDGPVLAYADAALKDLDDATARGIRKELDEYLSGAVGPRWADGYLAVQELTAGLLKRPTLDAAYTESRRRLQAGEVEVYLPIGLRLFLSSLNGVAERVLVTNAPIEGVAEVLTRLGLTSELDRVISSVGKPDGWTATLPQILGERPATAAVSVGDVYRNDIAPLIPYGVATAFIDRFGSADLPLAPTWTAPSFPDLYPALAEWLTSAHLEGN
ncbi:HAD family hydrolase [Rudaeicoccus suwonensis]|uniref:FMN phosphatase YigB (HAD superfamily) n=1 Tax=Rudaeicoccus suwonensis TaxID=657409 RepID=A0A561EA50_9MICO|nr:HAD family hydrolase [Rudaeicoccus suwonensis]TWE12498.1 FMN phosphatase YigB (HAD superfamily) [Rudaeicoccus suwonensis]